MGAAGHVDIFSTQWLVYADQSLDVGFLVKMQYLSVFQNGDQIQMR